uniref:Survival of motor neuron-related-splicing factor 30 n=1 Tax=Hirondellea gigas TaxID=1518452 RepID=A0A2P2I1U5_9CRUS
MADDLADSVRTYKIHLEQVQAALTSDPGNEELLKLRADLEEVIALTDNLTETATDVESVPSTSNREPPTKKWAVGDICLAQWSEDKQWYKATIDAVTNDGTVAVSFERYGSSDVTSLSLLRDISEADKLLAPASGSSSSGTKGPRKRQMQEAQRQQQKKKKQKKFDRQKQIDEAHETDKMRWQQFNSKSKKLKGVTRRSIFATPEAVNGRVGIGTCGIGGRPMTDYTLAEKRRRGM